MTNVINIHTCGFCLTSPGPGGYAAITDFGTSEPLTVLTQAEPEISYSQIEMIAAAAALAPIPRDASVKLHSNSNNLVQGMNNRWTDKWQTNGWKTSKNEDVLNRELWEKLISSAQGLDVEYVWIKSNDKSPTIMECRRLAKEQANIATGHPEETPTPLVESQEWNQGYQAARKEMREHLLNLDPEQIERQTDYTETYVVDGYTKCLDEMLEHLVTPQDAGIPS